MKLTKEIIGYIVLLILLIVSAVLVLNLFSAQRGEHDRVDVRDLPLRIGDWQGEDLAVSETDYDILETRNLLTRLYSGPAGAAVHLFVIYSETNRSVFHPPEACMIGSGMTITDKAAEEVTLSGNTSTTNKFLAEKDAYRSLTLYSYKVGDVYTDSYPRQQFLFALHQLMGRPVQGATIRVSAQITSSEAQTLSVLKSFMQSVVEELERLK